MKKYLWVMAALLSQLPAYAKSEMPRLQDGDLIFHQSTSAQSLAIQRATGSPYSHMGIVLWRDGKPYVFEAVATVRYTPLERWIGRGAGRRFVVKRLRDADKQLTPAALARLRHEASRLRGKPYDLTFEWSDRRIYCSELVWKMYQRALGLEIGRLQRIRDFSLEDPAVRRKLRERYGRQVPLDEPVVSPRAMLESALLETVVAR
ncbi:YiiX family permuted papain-like enzyme [Chitinimonas lacunae]|uniref:YiiX family permuted papain-like enzyme n=1 Tax=Chitinimonas lacunae TaxID=1963018 RepID=A0ABV8MJ64_9NEIS